MIEILGGIAFIVLAILILRTYFLARSRANAAMLRNLDEMFQKWDALLDAKTKRDEDVPDELMELGQFMIKTAERNGVEFLLLSAMVDPAARKNNSPVKGLRDSMREPLPEVFSDFVHAWFIYVANRSLIVRSLIRQALGRRMEREDKFNPYSAALVKAVEQRKPLHCHAAA